MKKKNSILEQGYIFVPYILSGTTIIDGDFLKKNRKNKRKLKIENIFN